MKSIKSIVSPIIVVILILVFILTSCDYLELETRKVVDYRHVDQYTEIYTATESRYNPNTGQYDNVPVSKTRVVAEYFELLWEYTYKDGHTERHWERCTRFEYEDAKNELGGD